jgi:hypothetical protein
MLIPPVSGRDTHTIFADKIGGLGHERGQAGRRDGFAFGFFVSEFQV